MDINSLKFPFIHLVENIHTEGVETYTVVLSYIVKECNVTGLLHCFLIVNHCIPQGSHFEKEITIGG